MKSNYPLSRKEDIVIQEADGEVLIYDLKDNKAFCLNETSALVWQMCDGNKSVSEISEELSKKLNSTANEDLVWLAIDELKREKLVKVDAETTSAFEGMSRREVIKKVGLGTMIALPIVTGLIAPKSVQAASACAAIGACTCNNAGTNGTNRVTGGDCVSVTCPGAGCRCRNLDCTGVPPGGPGFCTGTCATATPVP